MSPGEWERRVKAAEGHAKRRRRAMIFINDPEEGLDEYRLDPSLMTIQIGSDRQPSEYPGDGFNDLGILKLREWSAGKTKPPLGIRRSLAVIFRHLYAPLRIRLRRILQLSGKIALLAPCAFEPHVAALVRRRVGNPVGMRVKLGWRSRRLRMPRSERHLPSRRPKNRQRLLPFLRPTPM
jgi:hypothetical protein